MAPAWTERVWAERVWAERVWAVRVDADVAAVKRLVVQGADEGRWHYGEGCVTPQWCAIE